MGIGTRLSLIATAGAAVGCCLGIALTRALVGAGTPLTYVLSGLGGAVAVFVAAFPIGAGLDRAMLRFREDLASTESAEEPGAGRTPRWLAPLIAAAMESRERWVAEARRASGRLRELDIRRSVAEADLRRAEATLDTLRDAVLVTDRFHEVTMANASAARLLGFDRGSALRSPVDQVVHDEALIRLIRAAGGGVGAQDRKCVEHQITVPGDGAESGPRTFEVTVSTLAETAGDGACSTGGPGVVTILRDVTREKEISQMKSDFVSQVSHELRTPLSSINAYVEMLVDDEAKDEQSRREFYGVIKNEADRLGRLIDNMLNISRIEAGIVQVDRTEVDFVAVAREAIEVMQPQAQLKNITLLSKSGPLVYTAQADRDMMLQVALNLISNAVKYTPEGGRVTVSVENDDASRSVLVTVADTGLGIPPEALPKVFGKFYRIDNYKRVAKGTGLGLNLVKHIVETVHGGQVGVTSAVGMGSRFWFAIPFEPAARRAA